MKFKFGKPPAKWWYARSAGNGDFPNLVRQVKRVYGFGGIGWFFGVVISEQESTSISTLLNNTGGTMRDGIIYGGEQ